MPSLPANLGAPFLELEKPTYLDNESITLWVGVSSTSEISENLWQSCILHIVWPDGQKRDMPVSWPIDGAISRGWKGGWQLPAESQMPGSYTVAFEFAGTRTPQQHFTILKNPFADTFRAEWIFMNTSSGSVHSLGALLRIENRTGRVVRLAEPGLPGSEVSMSVKQVNPPSQESFFMPLSAFAMPPTIPNFSPATVTLTWNYLSRWSIIPLTPGDSVERTFLPEAAYHFRENNVYEVTLYAVLTVFVGERTDADSELYPLRIPVSATSQFHR